VEYYPRPTKIEEKIIAALDKATTVEFLDLPLEDCVFFLRDYHNINIWLDKTVLAKEAVQLDQPVTLNVAETPLRSVLKLLLDPIQLTYLIENDVMKITTVTRAQSKLITRIYPVADLHPAEPTGDAEGGGTHRSELATAIRSAVEPETWEQPKNAASITYVTESRSLVIRQTWGAHAEILELLRDLREAKGKPGGEKTGGDKK
jgi:hypothetical protein